ncbi:unannotated protein [freshwater metagenome]|uniref:Unannotated protein n=1 Tax=freshwater metagenome TaxID=449393 RepID=A0A6J6ID47_9ZZZZ
MARIGEAVAEDELRIGLDDIEHGRADDNAAQGQIAGRTGLRKRDHVGDDVVELGGEPGPESAEAGDHFVEDQQCPMFGAQLAQTPQVTG